MTVKILLVLAAVVCLSTQQCLPPPCSSYPITLPAAYLPGPATPCGCGAPCPVSSCGCSSCSPVFPAALVNPFLPAASPVSALASPVTNLLPPACPCSKGTYLRKIPVPPPCI